MSRKVKKTIYTVNINKYQPSITKLTFPLLKAYAHKIGAKFHVIDTPKWPEVPGRFEKFQIYELGKLHGNDWNIYIDHDCLVHPDMVDMTTYLNKDTVAHNGRDVLTNRYRADVYTMRYGVNFSSCNWLAVASDWCLDMWHPLEDMTYAEACKNIFPTVQERLNGIKPPDLIDDYLVTRNIARYGLKFTTIIELLQKHCGYESNFMMHHQYGISEQEKVHNMKACLKGWGLT